MIYLLFLESEKSKIYMKRQWEALKMAYKNYKNYLDIHIDTCMQNSVEHVTVDFFYSENPTDHKYSVVLKYQDFCWKGKFH